MSLSLDFLFIMNSILQLVNLKSATKNGTSVDLRRSANMIGSANDDSNFSHKLLLNNKEI